MTAFWRPCNQLTVSAFNKLFLDSRELASSSLVVPAILFWEEGKDARRGRSPSMADPSTFNYSLLHLCL